MDNDNKIRLFTGRDILFYSEKIKQPTVGEIIDLGWEKFFSETCLPYMINFEYIGVDESYVRQNNLKIFDLFWIPAYKIGEKTLLEILTESIAFVFRSKDITHDMKNLTISVNDFVINRDNFDELASYCREIFKIKSFEKKEEKETEIPEHLRKRYEKYKKHQAQNNKNDSLEILRVMNYIVYNQYFLDYSSLLNLTIFQFFNSQETFAAKEYYENNLKSVFAGADSKKVDLDHWMNKLRINKQ